MRTEFKPAPVAGWYASVPLDLLPPTAAAQMINWIPRETYIEMRRGTVKLTSSSLAAGGVKTMATHRDEDGTETLVCAAGGSVYSINTSTGAATSKGSGYSQNKWQTVNFNNLLLLVNGTDTPQQFDGTTLGNYAAAITGATPEDLIGVVVFKGRCIYWEANAAKFWYAEAGSYGGALTSFPLAVVTRQGGYVVECFAWTRDSGDGVDDYFVILMSTGETLVYQGSDPGSAQDWQLVGSFKLGEPLAIRGSCNLGADRVILTRDGFVNLSWALQAGRSTDLGHVSSNIIEAAKNVARLHKDNYGWEALYHDAESLLIVNVPVDVGERYDQYCMNTNTGAWCRLRDINATTFTEVDGVLYGGSSDGHIRKIFVNANDDGDAINHVLTPAFSNAGMPDRQKNLTYVTIHTNYVSKDTIGMAGLSDYDIDAEGNAAIPDTPRGTAAQWDVSDWDTDYWADSDLDIKEVLKHELPVSSLGYAYSCKMKTSSSIQTAKLFALRFKYKIARTI